MKALTCLMGLVVLSCIPLLQTKSQSIDSLERALTTDLSDTAKIETLFSLARATFNSDPQETLRYGEKAFEISQSINSGFYVASSAKLLGDSYLALHKYLKAIYYYRFALPITDEIEDISLGSRISNNLGIVYNNLDQYDSAVYFFEQALAIKRLQQDTLGMASTFNNLGYLNQKRGNIVEALDYYLNTRKILERYDRKSGLAGTLSNIGSVYAKLNDHDKAIEYYLRSEALALDVNFSRMLPELYNRMADSYHLSGDNDKAVKYVNRSNDFAKTIGDVMAQAANFRTLGNIQKVEGDLNLAVNSYRKALQTYRELGDRLRVAETSNYLADVLILQGQLPKARRLIDESMPIGESLQSDRLDAQIHKTCSFYYERIGDDKTALYHFKLFVEILDQISEKYEMQQIIQLQAKYESEQDLVEQLEKESRLQNAELEAKEATIRVQRVTQISIFLGLIILLIIVYFLFAKYRQKTKTNTLLEAERSDIAEKNLALEQAQGEIVAENDLLEKRINERTAQLQNTVNELEAYTRSVSHDLQTPIRKIANMSQLLLKDHGQSISGEANKYLTYIDETAIHMHRLTNNLLEFSKINRKEIVLDDVCLGQVVQDIRDSGLIVQGEEQVEILVDDKLPRAKGDEGMLRIVLTNLLTNAVKFTANCHDPKIEVGFDTTDQYFFVKDNGVGFNMKHYDKIFKPFSRLHKTSDYPGTGVGLSIVKRIVEKHGGRIWAESVEGEYAIFKFKLELSKTKNPA